MKVVFRADASVAIGSGHVARCVTLANALRLAGAQVLFVSREHSGHRNDDLVRQGFDVVRLPVAAGAGGPGTSGPDSPPHAGWLGASWEDDARQTRRAIEEWGGADWLVVDHYALDVRWESVLRAVARCVMAIDDLADRRHDCDLLLNQNCGAERETRYDALVPASCRRLLGPEYALLRREFATAHERVGGRTGAVGRILVFFGGTDPGNATGMAINALAALGRADVLVDVVVGAANPHRGEIEQACLARPLHRFHCQVPHMSELMAAADLAIGGGGVTLLERCAMALPAIIIALADNQRPGSRALAERGGAIFLGDASEVSGERLAHTVELLLAAPELVRHLGLMAGTIADGRGCGRVVESLCRGRLLLRLATSDDCENVWRWRNDAAVRRGSSNPDCIAPAEHQEWYEAVLRDPERILLIGENEDGAVGVLRYDVAGRTATISVYLVPGRQGKGLGSVLIREGEAWLREHRPEITEVRAEIDARNGASVRAFAKSGFQADRLVYVREVQKG
ncbi:MAG: UDP-2,4-diacetamido-2,4,6-trideoxy-beta-L-altropyranose hydrolase [Burkholderiales bacterium]